MTEDQAASAKELVYLGWRKIAGNWHCPLCAERRKGVKKS